MINDESTVRKVMLLRRPKIGMRNGNALNEHLSRIAKSKKKTRSTNKGITNKQRKTTTKFHTQGNGSI